MTKKREIKHRNIDIQRKKAKQKTVSIKMDTENAIKTERKIKENDYLQVR